MYINTTALNEATCNTTLFSSADKYDTNKQICTKFDPTPNKCSVSFFILQFVKVISNHITHFSHSVEISYCISMPRWIKKHKRALIFCLQWMYPTGGTNMYVWNAILMVNDKPQGILMSQNCLGKDYFTPCVFSRMSFFREMIIGATGNNVDNQWTVFVSMAIYIIRVCLIPNQ